MTTISHQTPNQSPGFLPSAPPLPSLRLGGEFSNEAEFTAETPRRHREILAGAFEGLNRRWRRERRRRKVGRAYDMALEIARLVPIGSEVLDIGCGNGFIAHHLSAMLGVTAVGIDLEARAEAPIDYRRYDGERFPAPDKSFDAVLLCYVLHHAQEVSVVLDEVRRVLREGGLAIIYEDIPARLWDKGVCWIHNQQWRARTGPCTFRFDEEWRALFDSMGFEIVNARSLSRWRNLTHPVSRRFYLVRLRMGR
jgi:SAM-dependent methyltransferase